jgi:hypothetical protein
LHFRNSSKDSVGDFITPEDKLKLKKAVYGFSRIILPAKGCGFTFMNFCDRIVK